MIIHQPRLAWDAARAFVTASESESHFGWLSEQVRGLLGPAYQEALAGTRHRLMRPARLDAREVESGTWRVRFEDLLRQRPDVARPLKVLVTETTARVGRSSPYWPVN
jgi:hypothetical protein